MVHLSKDLIQHLCLFSNNKNLFFTCKHYYARISLYYKEYPMKLLITKIPANKLPEHLHTLRFGFCFDQDVSQLRLPEKLHTLTFGEYFNQDVSQLQLPCSLHTLTFGDWFNQDVSQLQLPSSLHTLTFGWCFNQDVSQLRLPPNCKIQRK